MAPSRSTTADLARRGSTRRLVPSLRWRALERTVAVLGTSFATLAFLGTGVGGAQKPPSGPHGEVHLAVWSVDSDGPDFQAILSGAVGDYGPALTVLPSGQVDPEHTTEMELELRHGTFRLYIGGIANKFRAYTTHEPVYARTCSDYVSVTADVPVVVGSGTGSYGGIRGNFSLSLAGLEDQQTAPCRLGFARQILILTGSGTVSY